MTRGWFGMVCWNGLSEAQQRKLIERGTLNYFDPEDRVPAGKCQRPANVAIETEWDEAPGPRFYCLPCALERLINHPARLAFKTHYCHTTSKNLLYWPQASNPKENQMPRPYYQTNYYIVEHPTRGTLRELEHDYVGGGLVAKARFSTTGARNDSDKAQQFPSVEAAQRTIDKVSDARIASKVRIRRATDWKALCPQCGEWADTWHEHARTCPVYREEVARHG